MFVYIFENCLFTFAAVCLPLTAVCLHLTAVCLHLAVIFFYLTAVCLSSLPSTIWFQVLTQLHPILLQAQLHPTIQLNSIMFKITFKYLWIMDYLCLRTLDCQIQDKAYFILLQDHPTMLHQYLSGTCPGQAQSCPAQTCPGPVQDKHLTWGLVMIQSWFHRLCHKEIQKKLRLLQCHLQSQWLHRQTVQEKLRWVKTKKMSWKRRKSVSRNGQRPSTGWHRRWKWPKSRKWQVYLIRKDAKIPIGNFLNYYFSNYFSCLFTF